MTRAKRLSIDSELCPIRSYPWLLGAQRRYLAAIKALATVRRLLTPAVQVNTADQQVNISRSA